MKFLERKASTVRAKSVDELKEELLQLKKETFNLRFQKVNGGISDTSRRKWVRRKVALIKTLLNEKVA